MSSNGFALLAEICEMRDEAPGLNLIWAAGRKCMQSEQLALTCESRDCGVRVT